ncbi:hypothetical protein OSB04_017998 [Centaurea solstitialis]|uniref:LysM domain-containing protein n=1 Tax=Centaurea solstitialis TaxID=347529 RepID=A0AA38TBJ0_9ASTR|nr:hypothetical protein OSB04_017998 [Centaurea solstitialis]
MIWKSLLENKNCEVSDGVNWGSMQMQQRRNGRDNWWNYHQLDRGLLMESSPSSSKLIPNGSSSSSYLMMQSTSPGGGGYGGGGGGGSSVGGDGGLGYIEHTVTRFDTLAGVAIKYGVEVADIKKMNGLTTDLQMFARKSLQIPLPGRHPPSPIMSNGSDPQGPKNAELISLNRRHSDFYDSIKSLKLSSSTPRNVSPSMDALRNYYGLKPKNQNGIGERSRMDGHQKGGPFSSEYGPKPSSQSSCPPHGLHRKCRSLAHELSETNINGDLLAANGKQPEPDSWYDTLIRRRRSEFDLKNHTPEMMLKPADTSNNSSAFSAAAGKGLALRPKAANRTSDAEVAQTAAIPVKLGESVVIESNGGVKKSSSTPSFYDVYSSNNSSNCTTTSSSIWPTSMLNLTADLQASTAAITRPIFDGLPKPMSGRKNKAAID